MRGHNRRGLIILAAALFVVLAGCSGTGGDDVSTPVPAVTQTPETGISPTPTPEPTAKPKANYPNIFDDVIASVDNRTAERFQTLVTAEDGTLTKDGKQFIEQLEAIDEFGTQRRDAVVEWVVDEGLDGVVATSLGTVLASPDSFTEAVFATGVADTSGDGLLDGELAAVGLNISDPDERAVPIVRQSRDGGYNEHEIAFLRQLADLNEFGWTQVTELGLLDDTAGGNVTEADVDALADVAGDGLLNATATRFGANPNRSHKHLATVTARLGTDAFSLLGRDYLTRLVTVLDTEGTAEQVLFLDVLDDVGKTVARTDLDPITDDDSDGLLNAMEAELNLNSTKADPAIGTLVTTLAQDGYNATEQEYVRRATELRKYRNQTYELWSQAKQLGLLDEAVDNGTVTDRLRWQLANNDSDRLLNGIETEFGSNPNATDTSGDGYADHLLWGPMQDLGLTVSPTAVNVFVEVDLAEGVRAPSDTQLRAVQKLFATEPPDSIGPIQVRFRVCHTEQTDVADPEEMIGQTADKRNITGLGFHYLLLSNGLTAGQTLGATLTLPANNTQYADLTSWMVVDGTIWRTGSERSQAGTIAHELGHTLGIDATAYAGVDSRDIPADEYESIMNYNKQPSDLTFSTTAPFNDYEHMANQTFGSQFQNQRALEAMWENGSADENALC
ncbi:hypothetical protein ACFQJ7_16980 [Halovenus rubra]|uniref:Metallo-peptidase family M12B Reprolysin-like n=2 Tax=Halovenus rubra TaxID=869890 RepID=A0ABD5X8V2_9EURY|nr:hypothetical protein [Halovenus rubra]